MRTMCLLLTTLWLGLGVSGRMTTAEKKKLREDSDAADLAIRHLEHDEVASKISRGVHILFLGAVWCKFTQRFNPKWLEIQNEFDARRWNTIPNFSINKVECSHNEYFCINEHGTTDGYPTIILYVNGRHMDEFHGPDELEPMMDYIGFQLKTKIEDPEVMANMSLAPAYAGWGQKWNLRHKPVLESAAVAEKKVNMNVNGEDSRITQSPTGPSSNRDASLGIFPVVLLASVGIVLLVVVGRRFQRRKTSSYHALT